jgi:propane monooxygenase reductase subunit
MARVALEPIGEEIDCGDDETVLDAAFRQGLSLVYGCREGQCSACKAYLLEGEVTLRRYSSFALSESEEAAGYTLLCRAMPDDDLVIELLHFDPDNLHTGYAIRDGRAEVVAVEALTHDISRLALRILEPEDFTFRPGHYVDVKLPGSEERRSFSMANLPGDGHLELIVKRYPGGAFSGLLDGALRPGDQLELAGPYGAFYLRDSERSILMIAGGSGMAPELALLRQMARERVARPVRFFYGARTRRDLFSLDLVEALGAGLDDFRFVAVLSEPTAACGWEGETGFVHEAVARALEAGELSADVDAYLCGPPPLVDAAIELLVDRHGVDGAHLHFDKFTTAAAADADVAP